MEKERFFKILAKAPAEDVKKLADSFIKKNDIMIVKEPEKSLAMIKVREPVKESLFYLGEVIICESEIVLNGQFHGKAVTAGEDLKKVLHMAVIDACVNAGIFHDEEVLLEMEKQQQLQEEKEQALYYKTKVDFQSMDSESKTLD